jgi:glycosyltransferase involved in cell wall biosynthesis
MPRSIYICYFGLEEPLVQTQVLPYLRLLANAGHEIDLLTFEQHRRRRWSRERAADERGRLAAEGIRWHMLGYHKRPTTLATAYDILRGTLFVRRLIATRKADILHGRVHVPTLIGALARKFSRRKPKLLFDIRGFFPEEYTDAGIWPENGWLFRAAKAVERWLLRESDGFVVLTEKARKILFPEAAMAAAPNEPAQDARGRPVQVIPCCADLGRFQAADNSVRHAMRQKLGIAGRFVAVYVGSLGGWYLTQETADLFVALKRRRPDAFALILTRSDPALIEPALRAGGLTDGDFLITGVEPADVPGHLQAADVAISLCKPSYSKQAASPTKNAEYLACGLPIIGNVNTGDVDAHIGEDGTGVLLEAFDRAALESALDRLDLLLHQPDLAGRCRQSAVRRFDLVSVGGERYRRLYERLLAGSSEGR